MNKNGLTIEQLISIFELILEHFKIVEDKYSFMVKSANSFIPEIPGVFNRPQTFSRFYELSNEVLRQKKPQRGGNTFVVPILRMGEIVATVGVHFAIMDHRKIRDLRVSYLAAINNILESQGYEIQV